MFITRMFSANSAAESTRHVFVSLQDVHIIGTFATPQVECVNLLLSAGVDVNAADQVPTAQLLCSRTKMHCLHLLPSAERPGSLPLPQHSLTPLHCAASNGHQYVIEALVGGNADTDARDEARTATGML